MMSEPNRSGWRRWLLLVAALVPIAILVAILIGQLKAYGPTPAAADPDGYVSYAEGLARTGTLQEHRRLPGYPAIIVAVDAIGPFSLQDDVFWFHLGLTVIFALATTVVVWRCFGYLAALGYLAILSINSHFAHAAIVMLADLPHTVLLYLAVAAAAMVVVATTRNRWLWLGAFAALCVGAFVIHPSGAMRLQLMVWTAIGVLVLHQLVVRRPPARAPFGGRPLRLTLISLLSLSVVVFAADRLTMWAFQIRHVATVIENPSQQQTNATSFLRSWTAHRMLLCLPPPSNPDALDLEIERTKETIAKRLGYPTEAVVPPGYAPEFLDLMARTPISIDVWHWRLIAHPFQLVSCALQEMRAKWHYLVRNLTPFTEFGTDKTYITPDYPPQSPAWRDKLFWQTGISLFSLVPADAPDDKVRDALVLEIARSVAVLGSIFAGLVLIDRRWPLVGTIFGLSTVGWFALLAFGVPVETRYFMPIMPVLYLAQGIVFSALTRLLWRGVNAAGFVLRRS
jgi:hypothetical protein